MLKLIQAKWGHIASNALAIIDLSNGPSAFSTGDFRKNMLVVVRFGIYDNGTLTLLLHLTIVNILNMT